MPRLPHFLRKLKLRGPETEESSVEIVAEARELTREEFRAYLELQVKDALGIPLSEFMDALAEGRLDPESPRVASLAILVGARTR